MTAQVQTAVADQAGQALPLRRFLSLYRYFSYMVGVGTELAWASLRGELPDLISALVLGAVGVHTVVRVVFPFYPPPTRLPREVALALDLVVALGALLLTGGVGSGLLVYSLIPILAAAFFLEARVAFVAAGASVLALLSFQFWADGVAWILSPSSLTIFLLYGIAAALAALVPFLSNLNLRRRLERVAMAQERRHLRREVHDSLAQEIGWLNLQIQRIQEALPTSKPDAVAQEVAGLQRGMTKTYEHVRGYLDFLALSPSASLASALAELVQDFSARTGILVETSLAQDRLALSPRVQVQTLAIAQEALRNVQKHAQAGQVRVALRTLPSQAELLVEDDGLGFDPKAAPPAGHYGLTTMQERAQEIGATLSITSTPGRGTQLRLLLPQ